MRINLFELYPSDSSTTWIHDINLAWLAGFSLYNDYVPFFEYIFNQNDSDWDKFFVYLKKLEKQKKSDRDILIKKTLEKE